MICEAVSNMDIHVERLAVTKFPHSASMEFLLKEMGIDEAMIVKTAKMAVEMAAAKTAIITAKKTKIVKKTKIEEKTAKHSKAAKKVKTAKKIKIVKKSKSMKKAAQRSGRINKTGINKKHNRKADKKRPRR